MRHSRALVRFGAAYSKNIFFGALLCGREVMQYYPPVTETRSNVRST